MSEQTIANIIIAFIAVVPTTSAAVASLVIGLRNGRKSDDIHVLVNGNMTHLKAELASAKQELADLRLMIVSSSKVKP